MNEHLKNNISYQLRINSDHGDGEWCIEKSLRVTDDMS